MMTCIPLFLENHESIAALPSKRIAGTAEGILGQGATRKIEGMVNTFASRKHNRLGNYQSDTIKESRKLQGKNRQSQKHMLSHQEHLSPLACTRLTSLGALQSSEPRASPVSLEGSTHLHHEE
jgi:hypothetical protein